MRLRESVQLFHRLKRFLPKGVSLSGSNSFERCPYSLINWSYSSGQLITKTGVMTGECMETGSVGPVSSSSVPRLLQDMSKFTTAEFVNFFTNIDVVMFDCDGVLWLGDYVFPGADVLVKRLRSVGKRVFFLTNNSTRTREDFIAKFNKLGFSAEIDEVISTSYLSALHLKELNFQKKVYAIGTRGVTGELEALGIESLPIGPDEIIDDGGVWLGSEETKTMTLDPDVGAVIVGFDQFFNYKKMYKAASYLKNQDVIFIATNTDEQFPSTRAQFTIPGTGSIVNAVKTAAGREPIVIGKPFPAMFDFIQRTFKVDPNRTLMVGDRANTDIMFGRKMNLWTLLVLSGVTTLQEAQAWKSTGTDEEKLCVPHFYLNEFQFGRSSIGIVQFLKCRGIPNPSSARQKWLPYPPSTTILSPGIRYMSDEVRYSKSYTPRRAVMYVPGNDERKIAKIPSLDVDCVVLDCEDGVALNKKEEARERIRSILDSDFDFGRSECTVRVNSVDSGLCDADLERILTAKTLPTTLHLPKVDFVDQLDWFADTTNQILEKRDDLTSKINLILFIESAQSVLALPEICKQAWLLSAKSHFVPDALVFGSDDFCADIGATRTKDGKELMYARQYLVLVAKAFKLQAIDMVHIDYKDLEGLRAEALSGFQMGFTGKQVIHPGQIKICQDSFTPSDEKIKWAKELIESFNQEQGSGKGAFNFRGQMIDMPLVLQAKNIVELAEVCGK